MDANKKLVDTAFPGCYSLGSLFGLGCLVQPVAMAFGRCQRRGNAGLTRAFKIEYTLGSLLGEALWGGL